jgi:S1-C subfamily serine protease
VKRFISISIATLLTATACGAPERIETSCPRAEDPAQLLKSANLSVPSAEGSDTGIFFFDVAPDSFWACAGIGANALITEVNSRPVPNGPEFLDVLELITQDAPLEFNVLDASGNRRTIVVR